MCVMQLVFEQQTHPCMIQVLFVQALTFPEVLTSDRLKGMIWAAVQSMWELSVSREVPSRAMSVVLNLFWSYGHYGQSCGTHRYHTC